VFASSFTMDDHDGFTHLHVSGLPADCSDADVEVTLCMALSALQPDPAGAEAFHDGDGAEEVQEQELHWSCPRCDEVNKDTAVLCYLCGNKRPEEQAEPAGGNAGYCAAEKQPEAGSAETQTDEASLLGAPDEQALQKERAAAQRAANASLLEEQLLLLKGAAGTEPVKSEVCVQEESPTAPTLDGVVAPFISCTVVRNKDTGACKGYCFLGFTLKEVATEAMEILNQGVEVAGRPVMAQVSQPKERHAQKKEEELGDMRLRRQRFEGSGCSKKKFLGHFSCSDKTKTVATRTGAVAEIVGTRGKVNMHLFDDLKPSSRHGGHGHSARQAETGGFAGAK